MSQILMPSYTLYIALHKTVHIPLSFKETPPRELGFTTNRDETYVMISEISKPTVEDYISEMIFVGNISSESFLKTF